MNNNSSNFVLYFLDIGGSSVTATSILFDINADNLRKKNGAKRF